VPWARFIEEAVPEGLSARELGPKPVAQRGDRLQADYASGFGVQRLEEMPQSPKGLAEPKVAKGFGEQDLATAITTTITTTQSNWR
jgi:hypothetical protein